MSQPKTRFDLTTIGEGGLRLSVPSGQRLETVDSFEVNIAGAEANVACALSRLGRKCGWISGLPDSPLGRRVANTYRLHGLDMDRVIWSDSGRLSTYFVEYATDPRPIQVYYDRKQSCFTQLSPQKIDWDYLLDTRLLHLTGITVPLSTNCTEIVTEAVARAKEKGIPVSFDINYRSLLWQPEEAASVLSSLIHGIELLFCSHRDAVQLFECAGSCQECLHQLATKTEAAYIVMSNADDGIMAWHNGETYHQAALPVNIIDRLGAGDGLAAGVIHGWLADDFSKGLQYGVAMAALALSQQGEQVITTQAELDMLLSNELVTLAR